MIAKISSKLLDSIHNFVWGGEGAQIRCGIIHWILFSGFSYQRNFNLRFPEALEQVNFLTSFFPVTAGSL